MAIIIAPSSLDTELRRLLDDVNTGKIQLPEFQRSWTWDDNRIRGILASLSQGYPMGAIMRLQYGNESIRFKYRTIEGVKAPGITPDYLVLDGQQRLTSMFRAITLYSPWMKPIEVLLQFINLIKNQESTGLWRHLEIDFLG